jgi:hypothetical protein
MSLVGRLEDLSLPDILQLIALSKRTGKLTLSRREGTGVIVCREGKIIYAASDSVRNTLGNILVTQNILGEADLLMALEAQHQSPEDKRLGSILVEKGYVDQEKLEHGIRGQFEKVIAELLAWKTGFFRFELMEAAKTEEIEVDAKDFLLQGGLSSDGIVQEAMRQLQAMAAAAAAPAPFAFSALAQEPGSPGRAADTSSRAPAGESVKEPVEEPATEPVGEPESVAASTPSLTPAAGPAARPEAEAATEPVEEPTKAPVGDPAIDPPGEPTTVPLDEPTLPVAPGSARPTSQFQALAALKEALAEIRSPSFTGEIALLLLRYAEQVVRRAVIFGLRKDGLAGMGQRGVRLGGVSADERVRALKIPLDEPSVFYEVVETKRPYRGKLDPGHWNDHLVEQLGGLVPTEVIVIPMIVNGNIVVTFYGDNAPDSAPLPPSDGLELLISQVGLDMERNLLETRIKSLEKRLRKS